MFTKFTILAVFAVLEITQVSGALTIRDIAKAGASTGRNCSPIPACQFVWDPPMEGCDGGKVAMAEIATACKDHGDNPDTTGYKIDNCPGYTMDIKRFTEGAAAQVLLFRDGNLVTNGDAKWNMNNCKIAHAGSIGCTVTDGGCEAQPTT